MIDPTTLKSIEDLHRLKTRGRHHRGRLREGQEEDFEKAKERLLFGAQASRPAAPAPSAAPVAGPWDKLHPSLGEHLAWVVLPLRRHVDFQGRSSRKEFWMFQLVFVALGFLAAVALDSPCEDYREALGAVAQLVLDGACRIADRTIAAAGSLSAATPIEFPNGTGPAGAAPSMRPPGRRRPAVPVRR